MIHQSPIAPAWARTAVNAVVYRRNSVVSDDTHQYTAFYDPEARVVVAKRALGSDEWEVRRTPFSGNTRDAHNSISIMLDGDGYVHLSWDHHVDPLHYCRSLEPGGLDFSDQLPMTGDKENHVTYPEFHRLPDGDLLFLYRDGSSGKGDLILNHYDRASQTWTRRQDNLIGGEGQRNAYWQMSMDQRGTIHLSWVWRETGDVATNHDICYARSDDAGHIWRTSDGTVYKLPITLESAEYAVRIPQNSELINQTSMCADSAGRPYIATYWRPEGTDVPQYHLVFHDGDGWQVQQVSQRTTPFRLGGFGTRSVPISRPQIMAEGDRAYLVFRDGERGDRVSLAACPDLRQAEWHTQDLTTESVGRWEPSYDTEAWNRTGKLYLFVQHVSQGDGETEVDAPPQTVSILEWQPD